MLAADPTIRADIESHRQRIGQKRSVVRLGFWISAFTLPAAVVLQTIGLTPWLALIPLGGVAAWLWDREKSDKKAGINCPTCRGPDAGVPLISRWICGNCLKTNNPDAWFHPRTFCEPCRYCTTRPSAVICRQCRVPIIFEEDEYNKYPKRLTFLCGYPPEKHEPEPERLPTLDDLIPFHARQTHTMIVGSTGSGKTEAMKQFVRSLLSQNVAGVVIDPHGDMAEEIARWPNDRLIYIKHNLQTGHTPTINTFEIHGVDSADYSPRALAIKKVIAQQLLSAFQEVTAAGEKSEITKNMQTILNPCIMTLLDLVGATIRDLQRFMDDNRNLELVKFGSSRTHYPDVSEFFKYNFHNKSHLRPTKDAIFVKLQDLLSTGFFADLTCAKSTISIEKAWNDRQIMAFNLSSGALGERESAAFGRLVVSLLLGVAVRRADIEKSQRIPCHLFIDEAGLFITPSITKIMREARKYGLILTLATQQIETMGRDLEKAILDSANVQMVGLTKPANYKSTANVFHLLTDDIATLRTGTFLTRIGNSRPFYLSIPNTLIGNKGAGPDWGQVKQEQMRYYRAIATPEPAHTEADAGVAAIQQALAKIGPTLAKTFPPVAPRQKPKPKKRTLAVDDTEGDVI